MRRFVVVLVCFLLIFSVVSAAVTLSANTPDPIYQGQSTTVTVTATASGTSASNVTITIGLPAGLSTSDSTSQMIASLSAGQSQSLSWVITGDNASTEPYTITFTASGGATANTTTQLSVLTPPFIEVSNQSCSSTDINVQDTVTISFVLKNTGGDTTNAQVNMDYNSDCFSLVSGQDPWSQDINAGGQVALSYDFNAIDAGTETITAYITSAYNNPNDYSCTITVSAVCGDGYCSSGETCSSCASDCGTCPTTPTPTPTPTLVPVSSAGTTSASPTPTSTPTVTPTPSETPGETPVAKKIEKLFEKTITKKPTAKEIKELLEKVGASEKAIEAATKALSKTTVRRTLKVEKITLEDGNITFRTTITLEVSNKTGKNLLNVKVMDVIPKNVLRHLDENIIESDLAFEIVEADPVVQFIVPKLDVNQTAEVSYAIKEDINTDAAEEWKAPFIAEFEEAPVDLCTGVVCEPQLCKEGTCDPATGECVYTNIPDGTLCGENKQCKAGECVEIPAPKPAVDIGSIILILIVLAILLGAARYLYKERKKKKTPLEKAVAKTHKEALHSAIGSKFRRPP